MQSLFYGVGGSPPAQRRLDPGASGTEALPQTEQGWNPVSSPRGQAMFAQFFTEYQDLEPRTSDPVLSPSGKEGSGLGQVEVTPAAYGLAAALCTTQGLPEPPMQVGALFDLGKKLWKGNPVADAAAAAEAAAVAEEAAVAEVTATPLTPSTPSPPPQRTRRPPPSPSPRTAVASSA